MNNTPRVAALQMNSGTDVAQNLETSGRLLTEAAGQGACLAALPENFAFMGARERDKLAHAEKFGSGPIQDFLSQTARKLNIWIVAGSVPIAVDDDPERVWAACLVFDGQGDCVARYDKIHLFDVEVDSADGPLQYRESKNIAAAPWQAVTVDTPAGKLGLSVCYDVRFPELYRALAAQGAELLCVPAAFTANTGAAHWEVLLRARAIENQCFVIAPGQVGTQPGGRKTWGHSMLVDAWGKVLACEAEGERAVVAELDRHKQQELRRTFPVLHHRKA